MKLIGNTRQLSAVTGLVVTALLAGCNSTAPKPIDGKQFISEDQPTSVGRFAQAQSAAGAKEDGMLYDDNFHGGELNSLGQGKLSLIVKGTTAGDPVFVYLNMPHDQVAARQTAVTAYLKSAGVAEDKIIVAEGPNPNLNTPTAYNLHGIYKGEGTSFDGEAASDASAPGAPMGAGGH
jgi:hypothetical protein